MEIAALLAEREEALAEGQSEREFCKGVDVPRSTLRDEVGRVRRLDMAPEVATFYTSPPGQLQLMRIVLAAHFVMTLLGCCGVALVKSFLLLAGLGPFVGTSYGAQQGERFSRFTTRSECFRPSNRIDWVVGSTRNPLMH